jgi:GMP synthase-like glutamine amidotransferase
MTTQEIKKVAILDLYNGWPNQGMKNIKEILDRYSENSDFKIIYDVFDVRQKNEVPKIDDYDIYISTGGPGSPFEGEGKLWEEKYFEWLGSIWNHNKENEDNKKHAFFICHSFQMICRFFEVARVCERKSVSFGIFPVNHTEKGYEEPFFHNLPEPFYVVDNREWQVIEPNQEKLQELGAEIISIEKERPHVPLERALMGIRFSKEIFAVQFHPEACPEGMDVYLNNPEKKAEIIQHHGIEKYQDMCDHLRDPDKILLTQNVIIPSFLERAIGESQLA